jgi:hypothetical protein
MERETISTPLAPAAVGPYSQAVKANGMIYCSGAIGLVPGTKSLIEGLYFYFVFCAWYYDKVFVVIFVGFRTSVVWMLYKLFPYCVIQVVLELKPDKCSKT